jgi:hypothetical protein
MDSTMANALKYGGILIILLRALILYYLLRYSTGYSSQDQPGNGNKKVIILKTVSVLVCFVFGCAALYKGLKWKGETVNMHSSFTKGQVVLCRPGSPSAYRICEIVATFGFTEDMTMDKLGEMISRDHDLYLTSGCINKDGALILNSISGNSVFEKPLSWPSLPFPVCSPDFTVKQEMMDKFFVDLANSSRITLCTESEDGYVEYGTKRYSCPKVRCIEPICFAMNWSFLMKTVFKDRMLYTLELGNEEFEMLKLLYEKPSKWK